MLSRRETLRGGSAAVVGIAVSGAVAARVAVDDPVVALRTERERIIAEWDGHRAERRAPTRSGGTPGK